MMMRVRKPEKKRRMGGFSVIEMLVVMAIMGVLAGVLLGFNRSSEKMIALATEQQRVISMLGRARSLAIQRYNTGSDAYTCGIRVDLLESAISTYVMTRSKDSRVTDCPSAAVAQLIESQTLASGITVKRGGVRSIYFSSPFLEMTFDPALPVGSSGIITLEAPGVSKSTQIEVTRSGSVLPKIN